MRRHILRQRERCCGHNGVRTLLWVLCRYPDERHIARWACLALAQVVRNNKTNYDVAIDSGACSAVWDALAHHVNDDFVVFGALTALWRLCEHDMFSAAVDFFVRVGIVEWLRDVLIEHIRTQQTGLLLRGVTALECIATIHASVVEQFRPVNLGEILGRVALVNGTDSALSSAVARVLRLAGLDDPIAAHPHLSSPLA